LKLYAHLIAFFILAQLIGIYTGSILFHDYDTNPYVQEFYLKQKTTDESYVHLLLFLSAMLIGTVFFLLLIKIYRGLLLFILVEFFLISVTSSIFFYAISRNFLGYLESMELGIFLGIILAILKIKFPHLKNFVAVISAGVVGALFGVSFSPIFVVLFLVALAIYDYIAVFKTKHMVTLAKFLMKKEMPLTISVKEKVKGKPEQRMDLGTGDILAPAMLEVSFLQINPIASFIAFLGAVTAILCMIYCLRKKKMIFPALPPIVAGMLLFLGIGYLVGLV